MGNHTSKLNDYKQFSADSYSDLDKMVFLGNEYMKSNLTIEEISPYFTKLLINCLELEKKDKVKTRHFFKWFDMGFASSKNILASLPMTDIINSLFKNKEKVDDNDTEILDEIPNLPQEISFAEQGLRHYFSNDPLHFESRVFKAPPGVFRWLAWLVMSGLPINRPAIYYQNLISYDIPEEAEIQIRKDLTRTLEENHSMIREVKSSMYRILKAITVLDKEMSYVQGMNFLVGFLLVISNRNEIDTFYLMTTLFSHTFSFKFGMRGFYMEGFPLSLVCTNIYEQGLQLYFPKLSKHLEDIGLPAQSWITPWMQMIYVNVFPDDIVLRIWDCFLIYGLPFLINFGLALTGTLEPDLLKLNDICDIQEYFKLLNPKNNSEFKDKNKVIVYDIETMLSEAVKEYKCTIEDIEKKLDNEYPDYKKHFKYDYRSVKKNINKKNKEINDNYNNINTNKETNEDVNQDLRKDIDINDDVYLKKNSINKKSSDKDNNINNDIDKEKEEIYENNGKEIENNGNNNYDNINNYNKDNDNINNDNNNNNNKEESNKNDIFDANKNEYNINKEKDEKNIERKESYEDISDENIDNDIGCDIHIKDLIDKSKK